jgi:hypothetical protein
MEPHRLRRWKLPPSIGTDLYTAARPGRSKGSKGKVPDHYLSAWLNGLPGTGPIAVVSLLGQKPSGISEWSFYCFFAQNRSFQDWIDRNWQGRKVIVLEHPTCDCQPLPPDVLREVAATIARQLTEGLTVVVMDSGGVERTGQVRIHLGAIVELPL